MIGFVDRPGFERHRKRFRSADLDVRLEDRVCLVTGANSGIGRATSRALAARGVAAEICGEAVHALVHNAGVLPDRRILTRDSLELIGSGNGAAGPRRPGPRAGCRGAVARQG